MLPVNINPNPVYLATGAIDETPVQVLKEPFRKPEDRSYMWVLYGGPLYG